MKEIVFPLLQVGDIEVRVSNITSSGVSLLIYKDARVDQNMLDATVGRMNWTNSYEVINNNLFCTIRIWDNEKKDWVSKSNVGIESAAQKEKGEASDAFKRAAFNWGLGRELYTAPFIWIPAEKCEIVKDDKGRLKCKTSFKVSEIEYDNFRKISYLVISSTEKVVFTYGTPKSKNSNASSSLLHDNVSSEMDLDFAFDTVVTKGLDKGKTLKEVYELNNARRIFWVAINDDNDIVKQAAKVIIKSNTNLSDLYKNFN